MQNTALGWGIAGAGSERECGGGGFLVVGSGVVQRGGATVPAAHPARNNVSLQSGLGERGKRRVCGGEEAGRSEACRGRRGACLIRSKGCLHLGMRCGCLVLVI